MIKLAIPIAIVIVGAHIAIDGLFEHFIEKDIFTWYGSQSKFVKTISKPLFACTRCMPSIWTFVIFWGVYGFNPLLIPQWILTTVCVVAFSYTFMCLIDKI